MRRALITIVVGLALLTDPFMQLWARPEAPWLMPFGIWLGVIGFAYRGWSRGDLDGA